MRTTTAFSPRAIMLALAALVSGCASNHFVAPQPVAATRVPDTAADLRIAEQALEAGDTELAVSVFQKLLKTDPKSTTAQLGLGDAMYQTGDLARAGVLYAGVAAAAPDDARAQLGLARVALRERRLDESVARYRKLVATQPENMQAAEGLGAALDLQSKHAEAQAVYRAALQQHPEVEGLKTDLGLSLILSGKAREGANLLLDIAGLPDAPPQARADLALAYGVLGNKEAAKHILVADMPADSAENDLQFYQHLRDRLGRHRERVGNLPNAQALPAAGNPSKGTIR